MNNPFIINSTCSNIQLYEVFILFNLGIKERNFHWPFLTTAHCHLEISFHDAILLQDNINEEYKHIHSCCVDAEHFELTKHCRTVNKPTGHQNNRRKRERDKENQEVELKGFSE